MKTRSLLIWLVLLLSLLPAYYFHRGLLRLLQPRRSFGRFLLYLLSGLVMVFAYTYVVVWIISRLFPLPLK